MGLRLAGRKRGSGSESLGAVLLGTRSFASRTWHLGKSLLVSISHLPGGSELFSGGLASGEGAHHLPAAQMSLGSIMGHLL